LEHVLFMQIIQQGKSYNTKPTLGLGHCLKLSISGKKKIPKC